MAKISEECQTHEILASPFVCDRILSHLTILTNLEFLFWHLHQGLLTQPHGWLIILGFQAGDNWFSLLHKVSQCMFTVNLIIKEERTCRQKKGDDWYRFLFPFIWQIAPNFMDCCQQLVPMILNLIFNIPLSPFASNTQVITQRFLGLQKNSWMIRLM